MSPLHLKHWFWNSCKNIKLGLMPPWVALKPAVCLAIAPCAATERYNSFERQCTRYRSRYHHHHHQDRRLTSSSSFLSTPLWSSSQCWDTDYENGISSTLTCEHSQVSHLFEPALKLSYKFIHRNLVLMKSTCLAQFTSPRQFRLSWTRMVIHLPLFWWLLLHVGQI